MANVLALVALDPAVEDASKCLR